MRHRVIRVFPMLLCASLLAGKEPIRIATSADDGIVYQFQGRVIQAGSGMDAIVDGHTGGGVGFSALFGDAPLRLRIRGDADGWSGKAGKGAVTTFGLGGEGVLFLPGFDRITPFLSFGAAWQHWSVQENDQLPNRTQTANRAAVRAEAGIRIGRRALVSVGVMNGKTPIGRSTSNVYFAVAY